MHPALRTALKALCLLVCSPRIGHTISGRNSDLPSTFRQQKSPSTGKKNAKPPSAASSRTIKAPLSPSAKKREGLSKEATVRGNGDGGEDASLRDRFLAVGLWSEPVADSIGYRLRGRLLLAEGRVLGDGKSRETVLYVELQNVSQAVGPPLEIYFDADHGGDYRPEYKGGLQCVLQDAFDEPVKETPFPFSGAIPSRCWVNLPHDGSIRLRANAYGVGRPPEEGLALTLLGHYWLLPRNGSFPYSLSGTFTVNPPRERITPSSYHVWQGTLTLPRMKIYLPRL